MKIDQIRFAFGKTYVNLSVFPEFNRTSQIPGIGDFLFQKLPGLREHKCFNEEGLTFPEEVKRTELAHVFEHVVIELILLKDPAAGEIIGWTTWDWKIQPRWSYEVEIDYANVGLIMEAIEDALAILSGIVPIEVLPTTIPYADAAPEFAYQL